LLLGLLVAQNFVLRRLQSDDIENFSLLDPARKAAIRLADLMVIRDPYVVLGLVIIGVFVLILVNKMPQARSEGQLPGLGETFKILASKPKYYLGVLAQVMYVGAQIMCWTYIYQYAEAIGMKSEVAANYQIGAFVVFLIGRGIGTYLLRYVNSGQLLMVFSILAAFSAAGTIWLVGLAGLYCLVLVSLFMSIMFPTIYGIALNGLSEDEAKIGAAGLVMAIVGGALMPKFQGMLIDLGGPAVNDIKIAGVSEVNFSFLLPLICFIYVAWYGYNMSSKGKRKPI
jgi:FHS family L-fucose permease-like MFS transporter